MEKFNSDEQYAHFFAGGIASTVAALLTSPLEVVKTRFQSTANYLPADYRITHPYTPKLWILLRRMVRYEGVGSLFKGLSPNIVGVAPTGALFFAVYGNCKQFFRDDVGITDSTLGHCLSALCGGWVAATVSNPIWFVKTRLQLSQERMSVSKCVVRIYEAEGVRGFYKGVTASYWGISDTVIHFVIYERLKEMLGDPGYHGTGEEKVAKYNIFRYLFAALISKSISSTLTYPHEVVRTRLREVDSQYTRFWQSIGKIKREEGIRGLYGGFMPHFMRQIPSTIIVLCTYETVMHFFRVTRTKPPSGSVLNPPVTEV
ncbi:unnamed protein product [Cyprideis torosa]|uniref:Uncharacterized protein n=1 Tax=Cyprideis torosa TaxID=163714 RepID=A0A7R8W4W3_9CRUS|nr:unnamed protein product [Cyprideis torosa]CAG0879247.1 unnamed protein product [Cyprideis torosa]